MAALADTFRNRSVLITGHTGFKGAWLAEWLLSLGARVTGLALDPPSDPALFDQIGLAGRVEDRRGDVTDAAALSAVCKDSQPDFIFHLAAQSLVRPSYARPVETFGTNVMGTVHLLEAIREMGRRCVAVVVTTDKCYQPRERSHAYRESDPLGGHDPYSSSKGAAELVVASYRRSFFAPETGIRVASARAGNAIGGGDWAHDRIVPDCIRALENNRPIKIRNPNSIRPWQHVLEPLSGYLWLAASLARPRDAELAGSFNFGPGPDANRTVAELTNGILHYWPGQWEADAGTEAVPEADELRLSTDRALHQLGWRSNWSFPEAIRHTVDWYRAWHTDPSSLRDLTHAQIKAYTATARTGGHPWAP